MIRNNEVTTMKDNDVYRILQTSFDNRDAIEHYFRHKYPATRKFKKVLFITMRPYAFIQDIYQKITDNKQEIQDIRNTNEITKEELEITGGNDNAFLIYRTSLQNAHFGTCDYTILFYNDIDYLKTLFDDKTFIRNTNLSIISANYSGDEFDYSCRPLPEKTISPILNDNYKDRVISDVMNFFNQKNLYKANNIPYKRGILLYGYPGNGKTTLINHILEKVPEVYKILLDAGCFMEYTKLIEYIKSVFKDVPLLIVIEDINSFGNDRITGLLNFLDGENSLQNVYTIGTTNSLAPLTSSLKDRPGRFDWIIHIDNPNVDSRTQFLKRFFPKLSETQIQKAVKLSEGCSAAFFKEFFLYSVVNKCSVIEAIKEVKNRIKQVKEYDDSYNYIS